LLQINIAAHVLMSHQLQEASGFPAHIKKSVT